MITGNKHYRVLVTGGDGYIGKHLQKYIFDTHDMDVYSLDKQSGFDLLGDRSIGHLETYDVVVHLASLTGVRASGKIPHRYVEDNIKMTMSVLNQCKEYDVPCLVASSSSVKQMKSAYAYSKYAIEQICTSYPYSYFTRIFRPFTVYGHNIERCYRANMLYGMIQTGIVPKEIYNATRDFTHIDDVCSAITLLIRNARRGRAQDVYEIGYCNPISTEKFMQGLSVDTSETTFLDPSDATYSESTFTCASPHRLYELGWKPKHINRT